MNDQTKPFNDFDYDSGDDQNQDRPLTNFLQSQQTVRTMDEEDDQPADEATDEMFDDDSDDENDEPAREADYNNNEYLDRDDVMGDSEEDAPAEAAGSEADQNKLNIALKALKQMQEQITTVIGLLEVGSEVSAQDAVRSLGSAIEPLGAISTGSAGFSDDMSALRPVDGRVVEGVFDGRDMVGSDGKNYLVPPNYASKSKLVEGDMLKLTITPKGSFIYKQIGPIERSRLIGTLGYDQTIGEYYATSDNRRWNVLKASVTYFKGEPGDEVVLLVPKSAPSKWAAVENIIKKNPLG